MSLDGILPVYKPRGMSSFDVIRRLKKMQRVRRIGHGGTLDMMAEGVLPVLYGEATKAFDYLLRSPKEYLATVQCGAWTDTDDAEGRVIEKVTVSGFNRERLLPLLPRFTGNILQTAPLYSALKNEGRRAYDLARAGREVTLKQRPVTIHALDITAWNEQENSYTLRVNCSSGTYVRSLARDLGRESGWGGYLTRLIRTYSAGISAQDCLPLENISAENLADSLIPLSHALDFLPALELACAPAVVEHGQVLSHESFLQPAAGPGTYRVILQEQLLALVEYSEPDYRYLRVFHASA